MVGDGFRLDRFDRRPRNIGSSVRRESAPAILVVLRNVRPLAGIFLRERRSVLPDACAGFDTLSSRPLECIAFVHGNKADETIIARRLPLKRSPHRD